MSAADPDARITWVSSIAAEFPGEHSFDVQATWTNEHSRAGVTLEGDEFYVFLNDATRAVRTREEAVAILRGIFADDIVAVAALADGQSVSLQLCPAGDPAQGFGQLEGRLSVDEMIIATWSRGLIKEDE